MKDHSYEYSLYWRKTLGKWLSRVVTKMVQLYLPCCSVNPILSDDLVSVLFLFVLPCIQYFLKRC